MTNPDKATWNENSTVTRHKQIAALNGQLTVGLRSLAGRGREVMDPDEQFELVGAQLLLRRGQRLARLVDGSLVIWPTGEPVDLAAAWGAMFGLAMVEMERDARIERDAVVRAEGAHR